MVRAAHAPVSHSYTRSTPHWQQRTRRVRVRIVEDGHEVDGFEASSPQVLRDSLRPIFAHLPPGRGLVQFTGVEEESLPFGLDRARREVTLLSLEAAESFLAA